MTKSINFAAVAIIAVGVAACGQSTVAADPRATPPPLANAVAYTPSQVACAPEDAAAIYPGAEWTQSSAGWDQARLTQAFEAARRAHWVAGTVVQHGRVVGSFGDITHPYDVRSIRKSVMGAVIGQLVDEGRLSLDATLADLNIEDTPALTAQERTATLRQLLQSRSGVYHGAAFATASEQESMPARDSDAPGSAYWYNNWGFNALGTIVRNVTGQTLSEVVEERVARPIGMQDFSAASLRERFEEESQHSAYLMWISTRDRARFGYLYLRHGCWAGRQVVPASWVAESFNPSTLRDNGDDFGYVWRTDEPVESWGMTQRWYFARGNNLQYVSVIPEWDMVVVLTGDMDQPGWINWIRKRTGQMSTIEDVSTVMRGISSARPH